MKQKANITKRNVRRKLKDGTPVMLTRYILHFTDPLTGGRSQRNFATRKEAEEARNQLVADISQGAYYDNRNAPTVEQAVRHWLKNREGNIRPHTFTQYQLLADYIIGPVLKGTSGDRMRYTLHKQIGAGCELIPMLGPVRLNELTTAKIRERFNALAEATSPGMARRALQSLGYALELAEEDFNIRTPKLPRNFGGRRQKARKRILTLEQTRHLLAETRKDDKWGIYVAWPFYTGTRIGEQLAILWEDIDFAGNQIHIRRSQNRDGSIEEVTKTEAGNRIIPMCQELREWLLEWKLRCPRKNGELHRVFPAQGFAAARPFPRLIHAGGPLLIANYRNRVWLPAFKRMELPHITPHAARHMVISALQAQGIEVGLVSKIVGHANPSVTIQHYTHPVRSAGNAMEKLVEAYQSN